MTKKCNHRRGDFQRWMDNFQLERPIQRRSVLGLVNNTALTCILNVNNKYLNNLLC